MFNWLQSRSRTRRKAGELYGAVVAAARTHEYYSVFRVPDTPEGRFEMLALLLFLALERVKRIPGGGEALAQGAIEAFVVDMDDCMREMGVGDLTVPKKVRRAAAAFYERASTYRAAMTSGRDADLAAALQGFIWSRGGDGRSVQLAGRIADLCRRLASTGDDAILQANGIAALATAFAITCEPSAENERT